MPALIWITGVSVSVQVALLGRYNIQTVGRRRFRILRAWEDEEAWGLWRATVTHFEDEPEEAEPPEGEEEAPRAPEGEEQAPRAPATAPDLADDATSGAATAYGSLLHILRL